MSRNYKLILTFKNLYFIIKILLNVIFMEEKKKFYPEPDNSSDFNKIETEILEFWNENNIFKKSIENRKKRE